MVSWSAPRRNRTYNLVIKRQEASHRKSLIDSKLLKQAMGLSVNRPCVYTRCYLPAAVNSVINDAINSGNPEALRAAEVMVEPLTSRLPIEARRAPPVAAHDPTTYNLSAARSAGSRVVRRPGPSTSARGKPAQRGDARVRLPGRGGGVRMVPRTHRTRV